MPRRLPGSTGSETRGGWSPPDHNNEKTDQTPPLPCPIQTGAAWTFRLKPKLTSALWAVKVAILALSDRCCHKPRGDRRHRLPVEQGSLCLWFLQKRRAL